MVKYVQLIEDHIDGVAEKVEILKKEEQSQICGKTQEEEKLPPSLFLRSI